MVVVVSTAIWYRLVPGLLHLRKANDAVFAGCPMVSTKDERNEAII